jgi:hypothetical protein
LLVWTTKTPRLGAGARRAYWNACALHSGELRFMSSLKTMASRTSSSTCASVGFAALRPDNFPLAEPEVALQNSFLRLLRRVNVFALQSSHLDLGAREETDG